MTPKILVGPFIEDYFYLNFGEIFQQFDIHLLTDFGLYNIGN